MKAFLFVALSLTFILTNAQNSEETEVENVIKTFFEGFHKADTLLMKQTLAEEVVFQRAFKDEEQKDVLGDSDIGGFLKVIGSGRPVTDKWEERILSYTVKVDGNMANAWTDFEFWRDGQFSHCGVNSFQLFHDNGAWKIIYLIDSRRTKSCDSYTE